MATSSEAARAGWLKPLPSARASVMARIAITPGDRRLPFIFLLLVLLEIFRVQSSARNQPKAPPPQVMRIWDVAQAGRDSRSCYLLMPREGCAACRVKGALPSDSIEARETRYACYHLSF